MALTTFLTLMIWPASPASSQVLFPRDYGNGHILTFSGGSPGENHELKVLSPSGNVVSASAAFLDVTFLSHQQVRVSTRNVTIETYRNFYRLRQSGRSQLLAAVYVAGTDQIVDGTLNIVTVCDPSPQFERAAFTGNQRWTATADALEGRTTTLSFDWKAIDAGAKNWCVGNREYNPPVRCQILRGNAAVLPNARTDSQLATLTLGGADTSGTAGKVSIEFEAPAYDPGRRNDYTVRIHNWQDLYRIGGEGSASGCNGSALDVRITVKPVNTTPRFVDGTPQDRDLPGLLNSYGIVLDVGRQAGRRHRPRGRPPDLQHRKHVQEHRAAHHTPYQTNCTETTCSDGVFDIDASNGQIRTKANKSYTRQPCFVVVTVTDSQGLSDRTYVWINDGAVPYQPWDLIVLPGETTILLSWLRPQRRPCAGPLIGYQIEWPAAGNSDWQVLVENTGSLATKYCDRGLSAGTTRYYRVRAINAVGYGNPSNVEGATTGAGIRA